MIDQGPIDTEAAFAGKIVEAGHEVDIGHITQRVAIDEIIVLQQIREEFDPEELEELKQKLIVEIDDAGHIIIELIHPPTIGYFDEVQYKQYLMDHSLYYDYEPDFEAYKPSSDGHYLINIAGERRLIAMKMILEEKGVDLNLAHVRVVARDDIDFDYSLSLQSRENTSSHIRPVEDAKSIARHYKYIQRKYHRVPKMVEIAKHFGFGTSKVADALTFSRLPDELQNEVVQSNITYSNAVQLSSLLDAFRKYVPIKYPEKYADAPSEDIELAAVDGMMAVVAQLKTDRMKGMSSPRRAEYIRNRTLEIHGAMEYQNGELFKLEEADELPRDRRRRIENKMVALATRIVMDGVSGGVMPPESLAALKGALGMEVPVDEVPHKEAPALF